MRLTFVTERIVDGTYRWEWRTFARSPAGFGLLAAPQTSELAATREHYVLSLASPDNVKIREECLDIKTLVSVDATGLEQWRPALKAQFPIDDAALDAAWSAWRIPAPLLGRRRCTLTEFLFEVVESEAALRAVQVEKRRTRLLEQGCPGEHVVLTVGGEEWESIAFEHVDPLLVWRAVRARGLESIRNTNYPAALKGIVGFRAAEQPIKTEKK